MIPKRKLNDNHYVKRVKPNPQPNSNGNKKAGKKPFDSVSVDIPEMINRIENGHGLKDEVRVGKGVDSDDEVSFELFGASVIGGKYVGSDLTVGNVGVGVDGFGYRAQATGVQTKTVVGYMDVGGKLGGAEAGLKFWEPDVGLDACFTANVTAVEGNIGPVGASIGLSADTGVKVGKDGVGFKFLGTGASIGRTTSVQLFGIGFSIKFW